MMLPATELLPQALGGHCLSLAAVSSGIRLEQCAGALSMAAIFEDEAQMSFSHAS